MQGTIEWFKTEIVEPPIAEYQSVGLIKRSANLIVWGEGGWIQQTFYIHTVKEWFGHNQLPFKITHWAFINFPES